MSFRLKTILGIVLIEILLFSILVISSLHYLLSSNERQFLSRGETTARLAATMTKDAVIALDLATLDALVSQTLQNPDVVYVRVRHKNGAVLAQGGDSAVLKHPFHEDKTLVDAETDQVLDIMSPIVVAGQVLAQIELGLDTKALVAVVVSARQRMLLVSVFGIGLVALFGYVLGDVLTRRFGRCKKVRAEWLGENLVKPLLCAVRTNLQIRQSVSTRCQKL